MSVNLSGRVALITGAGGGLGRVHALELAKAGAKVVVNDLELAPAEAVATEIRSAGGNAIALAASVTDFDAVMAMVADAGDRLGPIDILIANAGILRDKSFAKMDLADFRLVVDVHLMGTVHCAKALWDGMRERQYGRMVFTTSSSGLYGNFGQSNYGAAKMALVGLMQTLSLEGAKNNIRVNCLAPTAATAMTADLIPEPMQALLKPEAVSPGILALVGEDAPTRAILCAGAGHFERAYVTLTGGAFVGAGDVADHWDRIGDRSAETVPDAGTAQVQQEIAAALKPR